MTYRVVLEARARKEFLDLSARIRERTAAVIDELAENPRPPAAKRLVGDHGYRVRVGDYRVLYAVDDEAKVVRVFRLGHRREVYRRL